jgi:formylglycine-generating enzyme required for sulfatase activity
VGKAPKGKYLGRPTRVGAYPANKLGLCDMHGNMGQWCADVGGTARACRGGSWIRHGVSCQATSRPTMAATNRVNYVGFRLARVPER